MFVAVDVPVAKPILDFENDIRKVGADVKLVEPKNIHVTLKFLGDVDGSRVPDIKEALTQAVASSKPFSVRLKGSGVFPNRNYVKVVWVGIEDDDALKVLAESVDEQLSMLGFEKEKRGFRSHLTVGRVRSARNKQELLAVIDSFADVEFCTVEVKSIELKQSELTAKGPIYSTLCAVEL